MLIWNRIKKGRYARETWAAYLDRGTGEVRLEQAFDMKRDQWDARAGKFRKGWEGRDEQVYLSAGQILTIAEKVREWLRNRGTFRKAKEDGLKVSGVGDQEPALAEERLPISRIAG